MKTPQLRKNTIPVLLNGAGGIVHAPYSEDILRKKKSRVFPVVVEPYFWDEGKQRASAQKYKDQIMRIHYPEMTRSSQVSMLDDDRRRIDIISSFPFGARVLEVGSSDGTVSLRIAKNKKVRSVLAIDIRKDAVTDGERLVRELLKKGGIDQKVARKFSIEHYSIESYAKKYPHARFDTVCAFEVFEHIAPQDFLTAFKATYGMLKTGGTFYMSVPNRLPKKYYEKVGRSRWKWFDHRNYFTKLSLEFLLRHFFKEVTFYPLYRGESPKDSLYLIAKCKGKVWNT